MGRRRRTKENWSARATFCETENGALAVRGVRGFTEGAKRAQRM
jgi:hypothetical protein